MNTKTGVKKVVVSFEMADGSTEIIAIRPENAPEMDVRVGCRNLDGFVESTGEITLELAVSGLQVDGNLPLWTTNIKPAATPVYFMD